MTFAGSILQPNHSMIPSVMSKTPTTSPNESSLKMEEWPLSSDPEFLLWRLQSTRMNEKMLSEKTKEQEAQIVELQKEITERDSLMQRFVLTKGGNADPSLMGAASL